MSCPAVIEVYAATGPVVVEVVTPGPQGPIGSKWITGSGAPSSSTGAVGDFYLRENGDVYGPKASGGWGSVEFTLTGSGGAALSDDTPQTLGTAAAGTSIRASRSDHRHAMPSAGQVGADAAGTAAAAVATHLAAADPHTQYQMAQEVRCDSGADLIYVGRASPGTAESSAGWVIKRRTFTAAGVLLTTRTATGAWTNRASLTYS